MATNRHRVFISFQHGCEDTVNLCGKKTVNTYVGLQTNFSTCNGSCGRNEVGYNIQATADADHNIMIDYKTTN